MASSRDRRVAKELKDIQADSTNSGVTADLQDGADLRHLVGTITGPPDTPYAGGTFRVKITIPDDYPFKPPAAVFLTKMWHPNISSQTVSSTGPTTAQPRPRKRAPDELD
jgi:ubiquitin-conjugating enzyme (huntingtin interacting protein 2)